MNNRGSWEAQAPKARAGNGHPPTPPLLAVAGVFPTVLDKSDDIGQHRPISKRRSTKSEPTKGKDPCLVALGKIWPTILLAYHDFKGLKPIIEYQLRQTIVYAYPALDYINDLTDRTREQTRRIYREAATAGNFMVFVRDTRKRVLRSYVFPVEEPEHGRPESTAS